LSRNIAFCGTVREEGNGNLGGIAEVHEAMGERLGAVIAVDGGASSVVNRSLAIRRYVLKVTCPGGHSWGQFGTPSAIHEMAKVITALDSIETPSEPKTTYNIGTIRGGTSVNAIAQECEVEVDLRSLERELVEELERKLLQIVEDARAENVKVEAQLIGRRPAATLPPEDPLASAAVDASRYLGSEVNLAASSTDAAYTLARGVPSISFGIYHGGGGHTLEEFIELESLAAGLKWLALTVLILAGVDK
jgi:acetylornithine deacetylase/succinyl-diaminopimelate desuccinylase-like protein